MMISSVGFTQQVIRLAQSDNIALAVLSEESNWETIIWRQINNFDQSQFKHKVLVGEFSTDYPIVYWEVPLLQFRIYYKNVAFRCQKHCMFHLWRMMKSVKGRWNLARHSALNKRKFYKSLFLTNCAKL